MEWQQFFEIPDGGDRHLDFSKLYISSVIELFQIEVSMFPLILVTIGQIVEKLQPLARGPNQRFNELTTQTLRRLTTFVVIRSSSTIIACATLTARETATQGEVFVVVVIIIIIITITHSPSSDQDVV